MEKILKAIKEVLKVIIPILKKKGSVVGVKETKEAIIGFNEVSLVMVKILKDGVQFEDALAFYNKVLKNDELKVKIIAAYENYQAIPVEVKDIDMGEGLELLDAQIDYLPKYLNEFKKEEV